MIIRSDRIKIKGGEIPIELHERNGLYSVYIDGIDWFEIDHMVHAVVLFEMMKDHITEYMRYELKDGKE